MSKDIERVEMPVHPDPDALLNTWRCDNCAKQGFWMARHNVGNSVQRGLMHEEWYKGHLAYIAVMDPLNPFMMARVEIPRSNA